MERVNTIYIFPPFSLIPKVLSKQEKDQTHACLIVVPLWKSQHWFPKLLKLLTQHPVILTAKKSRLSIPNTPKIHPLWNEMSLLACNLSGKTLLTKEYQKKLQPLSWTPGETLPEKNMQLYYNNGKSSVLNKKLIPYMDLWKMDYNSCQWRKVKAVNTVFWTTFAVHFQQLLL